MDWFVELCIDTSKRYPNLIWEAVEMKVRKIISDRGKQMGY